MSQSNPQYPCPTAIVGIAAQLPSGSWADSNLDYNSFFDFLLNKSEAYGPIPTTRFNVSGIKGRATGQVLADTGVFLRDVDLFDHLEFGITAKDARLMPLSVRKLIEVAFLSLYDAGIDYRGKNVGCYMSGVAYDMFAVSGHDDAEATGSFAYAPSAIANRVSYHLDLRGPTVPLDTACSSSMYATHLAVQAVRNGECDAAVVGGSQINNRFTEWLSYTQGGILSPDGKCKPFDIAANGFGRGEGVVAIVLKPLDAAIRDHDHIYATILGTGVNSSGSLVPANAPAAIAQRDAMLRAFRQAGRSPQEVDFIELHATGTAQGDPTEANWVGAAFQRDDELVIGSVKGNIGHLEITAFLASLCKVCGIFNTGLIPPNVNLKKPNPAIQWSRFRLRVPLDVEALKCRASNGRPLIAMSSSGIGGANGHAVVEGPPPRAPPIPFWRDSAVEVPALLVAGGLSPRSAAAVGERLLAIAKDENEKSALAQMYGRRVRSMTWRAFTVAGSSQTAILTEPALTPKTKPPIVFVFSGQGTQHFQMGRELFKSCVPFRTSILELDKVYASVVGTSLISSTSLFTDTSPVSDDPLGDQWPIAITLPALTMLQLALVDALAAVGVKPDVVVGHSAGETAVLAASGSASKAAALELSIARGRGLSLVEDAKGTMAAVSCSPTHAQKIISEVRVELGEGALGIGCYNASGAVTLSGAESHVDLAVAKATSDGIFARRLRTRVPVHSEMMELCRAEYSKLVAEVFACHEVSLPAVETYSTVTGHALSRAFDADYYWDGTLGPVRFNEAIQALCAKYKSATFLEIGPHPALASYLQSMTEGRDGVTIACPLRRPRKPVSGVEVFEFVNALGKLVIAGHNCVDFDVLYGASNEFTGKLPEYPFAMKSISWYIPTAEVARQRQQRNGPMNYPQLRMNVRTHPGLSDHIIKGEPIMPAAGFIEMALEYGASEVYNVQFHGLLALSADRPVPVQVQLEGPRWSVRSASSNTAWPLQYDRLHTTGFLSLDPIQERGFPNLNLDAIRERLKPMDMRGFYSELSAFANYGTMYRRIRRCYIGTGAQGAVEALAEIRGMDIDIPNCSDYRIHPAILDAAIHMSVHPSLTGNYDPNLYHLPDKLSAFRLCPGFRDRPFPSIIFSHATFVSWTPDRLTYKFTITDEAGVPLCVLEGLQAALHGYRMKPLEKRFHVVYRPVEYSSASSDSDTAVSREGRPLNLENLKTDEDHAATDNATGLIIEYVRGEEIKLYRKLASHDPLQPQSLLFVAADGLDGDASQGFTRSLRKEYPLWNIRVVVFDSSLTLEQRHRMARDLSALRTHEVEMRVHADGSVFTPRIEIAPAPMLRAPRDIGNHWKIENDSVVQSSPVRAPEGHSVITISRIAAHHGAHWVFVGTADTLSGSVVGVSSGLVSSHVVVHAGSIAEAPFAEKNPSLGPPLLALVLVALVVSPLAFSRPERLRGERILVVDTDDVLLSQIKRICEELGMEVLAAPTLTGIDLEGCFLQGPSFILSGTRDPQQASVVRTVLGPRGRMLLWNHPEEGLASLQLREPWALGDAVRAAAGYHRGLLLETYSTPSALLSGLPSSMSVSSGLFDPTRSYLLVGGIGSLGLHMALWMYENGAREITLTSRSGVESLDRRGDYIGQRILVYLESRRDLTIRAISSDATSSEDMASAIQRLNQPLAGCVLMSAVLGDAMLSSHTEESFERAIAPKVLAFLSLEQTIEIGSLDFFITFSSVSGLFGNPGQTSYAAANSALAGMSSKYKNAFSIVSPIINDSRFLTLGSDSENSRVKHMVKWGMTARELCDYIGDGILKLRDGPFWQYVPDLEWRVVRDNMGPSPLYDHLVPPNADSEEDCTDMDQGVSLLQTVCRVLDVNTADVSIDVPLTTYGLDSLSAAALSFALRPLLAISQVQLLADLAIKDLQARMDMTTTTGTPALT